MKRNPPSPGFQPLNSGSFASAYEKLGEVELIIGPETNNYLKRAPANRYDLSRELLILARQSVPLTARKYIPEIQRLRIDAGVDEDGDTVAELVYSMPEYEAWFTGKNEEYIEIIIDSDGSPKYLKGLPRGLAIAAAAIFNIGRQYGARFDLRYENFSESIDRNLIIRDPLFLLETGYESVKISELWPPDQFAIFDSLRWPKVENEK
jgi:hypothetical protein